MFPHLFSKLPGMTTSIIKELQNSMDGLSNRLCIEKIKSRNFSSIYLRPGKLCTGLDTHWNMVSILNRSRSKNLQANISNYRVAVLQKFKNVLYF